MFIDRMLNQGNGPLLEQWLKFTADRHKLIAADVVNLSTPGYQQKDLSPEKFQARLREQLERGGAGAMLSEGSSRDLEATGSGMMFHDGATRSAEQLMTDQAKNALTHNMIIEMLRNQFQQLEMAIKLQPS